MLWDMKIGQEKVKNFKFYICLQILSIHVMYVTIFIVTLFLRLENNM